MARVHLVRHACAGQKEEWGGDDDARPLDDAGARQAEELATALAAEAPVNRLVSSAPARCVQTLEPLAARTGLRVEIDDRLRAEAQADEVLDLIATAGDGAVLCTHGETMKPVFARWRERGVPIEAADDDPEWLLGKGSAWTLDLDDGKVVALHHLAPMPVFDCPLHS